MSEIRLDTIKLICYVKGNIYIIPFRTGSSVFLFWKQMAVDNKYNRNSKIISLYKRNIFGQKKLFYKQELKKIKSIMSMWKLDFI